MGVTAPRAGGLRRKRSFTKNAELPTTQPACYNRHAGISAVCAVGQSVTTQIEYALSLHHIRRPVNIRISFGGNRRRFGCGFRCRLRRGRRRRIRLGFGIRLLRRCRRLRFLRRRLGCCRRLLGGCGLRCRGGFRCRRSRDLSLFVISHVCSLIFKILPVCPQVKCFSRIAGTFGFRIFPYAIIVGEYTIMPLA